MSAPRQDTRRIEQLIANLDALDAPRAAEVARALVQAVLELHGHGLARLVDVLGGTREGRAMLEALAGDPAVANLMLLHGVHPHAIATRIGRALDELRTWLGAHRIAVHTVSAERERVCVRLESRGNGRRPNADELRGRIETIVFEHAPEVEAVEIEGLPLPAVQEIRFVRRKVSTNRPAESERR